MENVNTDAAVQKQKQGDMKDMKDMKAGEDPITPHAQTSHHQHDEAER